jgi:thiol-disulfide isomerase/thioredoxin
MINGRTRWQGFERAWIDVFENAPIDGGLAKCNPLAYWTLEDAFDYIAKYEVTHHPPHAKGYPSHGYAKDTIPIPEDGSTRFVNFKFEGDSTPWLDYASERKGRFVGLANKDGSTKTECGIHVAGAEKTFDRDLWEEGSVKTVGSSDAAIEIIKSEKPAVIAVYAPWCQFCQKMEDDFTKFADQADIDVYEFRGDEEREFVEANLNTESFPTINIVKADGSVVKYASEDRSVGANNAFVEKELALLYKIGFVDL